MSNHIDDTLLDLEFNVKSLHTALDKISNNITKFENKTKIGCPFTYPINDKYNLKWDKLHKSYRILLHTIEDNSIRALVETRIEDRLEAFSHFHDFVKAFNQHIESQIKLASSLKLFEFDEDDVKEQIILEDDDDYKWNR